MTKRCLLTLRFGKDVADIILLFVWRSIMNEVNFEYHERVNVVGDGYLRMKHQNGHFYFNYRTDSYVSVICNINRNMHDRAVANLPKHYWKVNELY